MTEHKLAKGSLSGSKDQKTGVRGSHESQEGDHAATVRKLHHGYHVTRHHRDGSQTEHAAADLDEALDHVVDHLQADPGEQQEGEGEPITPGGDQEAQEPEQ